MKSPVSLSWRLGTHLYLSFEQQLQQRDDVHLLGKLRQLLSHSGTPRLLRAQSDYLGDTMSGESNALIEIHAAPAQSGGLLLAINAPALRLPQLQPLALNLEPALQQLLHWTTPTGVPADGLNAWARLGADKVEIRAQPLRI